MQAHRNPECKRNKEHNKQNSLASLQRQAAQYREFMEDWKELVRTAYKSGYKPAPPAVKKEDGAVMIFNY